MLNYIKYLFQKKPVRSLFIQGEKIRLRKPTGARAISSDKYVSLNTYMCLLFQSETSDKLIFKVRCNFYTHSEFEALDGQIIYFTKKNFKAVKFWRHG
jgi:hypothetical protein